MYYEYHKKSKKYREERWEIYAHLFEGMSDESREARYHLLDYLHESLWYNWTLLKDGFGKPIPISDGKWVTCNWSISHSENYIAFIVSSSITGIDIVEIHERDIALFDIHSKVEYQLLWWKCWENFYILWTAKEAIIKSRWWILDDMKFITLDSPISEGIYKFVFQDQLYTIKTIQENTVIISLLIETIAS